MPSPLHIHHQQLGEGPPLVILHGLFGSGTNWRSAARRLTDCRKVFLPDARNHGHSGHAQGMDYLTLARDTLDFMDQQDLASVDLLGHSMGGKTAMHLALLRPERVRSLLIVDIAPRVSPSDHLPLIKALEALPLENLQSRGAADRALAAAVTDSGLRAFLLQNLTLRNQTLDWRIDLQAIQAAMQDLLGFPPPASAARYPGPVLFLKGALSDYITSEDVTPIRNAFPHARIHTIADSGHWLHADQPEAFIAACRTFLGCADT